MSALRADYQADAPDPVEVEVTLEVGPQQEAVLASRAETICFRGGAGSGKTWVGATWALLKAIELPGSRGMIVSPTFPMLEQSVMIHLLSVGKSLGLIAPDGDELWAHHKTKREITLPNGSVIYLRSADKPERLLGADLAWVWGDEVALWQQSAYRYSIGRLRQQGFRAQSLFTFTPKGLNWAHQVFGAEREGLAIVAASTAANPWASKEFRRLLKREYGEGTRFYRQEVLGEFVAFEGLVYPHWGDHLLAADVDSLQFVEYAAGVDWGWSNPGVMLVIGRTIADELVVVREVRAPLKGLPWWAEQARALGEEFPGLIFFCDPSDPQAIEYLRNEAGVDAQRAANEVVPGIALCGGLMSTGRLLIDPSCVHLLGELGTYSWQQRPDGTLRNDEPVKANDHSVDAMRYGTMGLATQRRYWWQDQALVKELLGAS